MNTSINNSSNQGLNNCKDYLVNFWTRVPVFVKSVILVTLFIYILSIYTEFPEIYLGNTPIDTVNHFRIWTLFTSCMVNTKITNLIFAYISWIPDGIRLESSNGTIKYILNFFINNCVIQFTFIVVAYVLSFIDNSIITEKSLGLWPAIMAEITMLCIACPENYVNICLIPFEFRAKFYPLAIYVFLILANGFKIIILDVLIGIGFGFLYFFHLKNFLNVGNNLVIRTEKTFAFISKLTGFVPFQDNLNTGSFGYLETRQGNDNLNISTVNENYQDGSLIAKESVPKNEKTNSIKIEVKDNSKKSILEKTEMHEEDREHEKKNIPGESLDD